MNFNEIKPALNAELNEQRILIKKEWMEIENIIKNQRRMDFIIDFSKRIEKLRKANIISCSIAYCQNRDHFNTVEGQKIEFPASVLELYNHISFLTITQPRQLEILSINDMSIVENRYLHFANINFTEKLYFDMLKRNNAEEWDIVNLSGNFIVTKTIGSFLTNKVWAWIDRGREIWKDEHGKNK